MSEKKERVTHNGEEYEVIITVDGQICYSDIKDKNTRTQVGKQVNPIYSMDKAKREVIQMLKNLGY